MVSYEAPYIATSLGRQVMVCDISEDGHVPDHVMEHIRQAAEEILDEYEEPGDADEHPCDCTGVQHKRSCPNWTLKQAYLTWRDSRREYKRIRREMNLRPAWVSRLHIRWYITLAFMRRYGYLVVAGLTTLLIVLVVTHR